MAYSPNKELKLYYSIKEVAKMFGVAESLLRFWEKEFPIINPKKTGRNVRQYRKEDIENIKIIYHLIKEKGLTHEGARNRLKIDKGEIADQTEVIDRLTAIREELVRMRKALDYIN